jgi:hypothetical protein
MAGGSLHMSLDVGPVSAYCDVILDVFINFKPFYFIAGISLSVGVRCNIDILFVHVHISVSIGADLTLWGPDAFGGLAHVDFWFFGFDIRFGDGSRSIPGISLGEFYEMIRTPGPTSNPPATDKTIANNPYITQHKYSIETGLFPSAPGGASTDFPNTGAATEWLVQNANLQVRVDCDFALSDAKIISNDANPYQIELPKSAPSGSADGMKNIFSFPMHNTKQITSSLEIRIYSLSGEDTLMSGFTAELVLKNAALALWSKYEPQNDPLVNRNPPNLKAGGDPTKLLCQGVRLFAPPAVRSKSPIIDFDATTAMKEEFPYDLNFLKKPVPEQSSYLAVPLDSSDAPWDDFADRWSGKTDATLNDVEKAAIRGDHAAGGGGMLGLAADLLGWTRRPPADKEANVVVVPANGTMEWALTGDPPALLTSKLGDYYPALPMWTTMASA